MIPNFKMSFCHQKEFLDRPCNFQMTEKSAKKPMKESVEGFEYSSLWTSRSYSILSYIVGGFVGSKSQMNNSKHNLYYDLSAAVVNLLNPCKYEMEKSFRKNDSFCNNTPKITSEGYDKYIVKSSHKEKTEGLKWWEDYVFDFNGQCYNSSQPTRDFNCDENKDFSGNRSTMENCNLVDSVDVVDRAWVCGDKIPNKECVNNSVNFLASERFRQLSECSIESTDSESFIVFDSPSHSEESKGGAWWRLDNFDFSSDDDDEDDDDDDDDDDSDYDEDDDDDDGNDEDDSSHNKFDIYSADVDVAEANDRWLRNYEDIEVPDNEGQRKVRFNDDVKVNQIVAWDFAYRAARAGPWEQMARDRARFRERILRLSRTLSPILKKKHRDKIYKQLYS